MFGSFSCSAPSSVTADGGDLDHWRAVIVMTVMQCDGFVYFIHTFSVSAVS